MSVSQTAPGELLRPRDPAAYNPAERLFSEFIRKRVYCLLRGDINELLLMRRNWAPEEGIAFLIPDRLSATDLRPAVGEEIISGVLRLLSPLPAGGPISQQLNDAYLVECQAFPTQYPHVIIERIDVFEAESKSCHWMEWRAIRLQNQRRSTLINRALDLGNLAIEFVRIAHSPFSAP
jgi:hypothetical protein